LLKDSVVETNITMHRAWEAGWSGKRSMLCVGGGSEPGENKKGEHCSLVYFGASFRQSLKKFVFELQKPDPHNRLPMAYFNRTPFF
jgi:hypothetical protein